VTDAAMQKLAFAEHPEAEMRARADAFLALMSTRRSLRDFAPRPVPMEVMEAAIRTAVRAPSGANQQPRHFAVITGPASAGTVLRDTSRTLRASAGMRKR
jgi:nitroreductase